MDSLSNSVVLVIPAYNEAARLPLFLNSIVSCLRNSQNAVTFSILIMDDGSTSEQFQQMQQHAWKAQAALEGTGHQILYVRNERNQGKGAVLASAFRKVINDVENAANLVGFIDADGATPFSEFLLMCSVLCSKKQIDGIIASRIKMLGKNVQRRFIRHLMGRIFATIVSSLFKIPVYDTQCGAKLFRKHVITNELLDFCFDVGWTFDTKLLIRLWFDQKNMEEFPVSWTDLPGSKVSLLGAPLKMFLNLLKFKRKLMQ